MNKLALVFVAGVLAVSSLVFAQPPLAPRAKPPKIEMAATKLPDVDVQDKLIFLFDAIQDDDYTEFVRFLSDEFKKALPQKNFAQVSAAWKPRLEKGYDLFYMGEINKTGLRTYAWRVVFRDGGDEVLATLTFKVGQDAEKANEKVGGLYIN